MIRIKFSTQSGDIANPPRHEHIFEYDEMPTEEELDKTAQEFMWENVRPEAWWEVVS